MSAIVASDPLAQVAEMLMSRAVDIGVRIDNATKLLVRSFKQA
jgi:hypothetical protein